MDLLPYDSLMQKLRDKRRDRDLTQKAVATNAGISTSQLSRMENGNADAKYRTVYNVWEYLQTQETDERQKTAAALMCDEIEWVTTDDSGRIAKYCMMDGAYSQLPVRDAETGEHVGGVTERRLIEVNDLSVPVGELMTEPFIEVRSTTSENVVVELFRDGNDAVLVRDGETYQGIITPADVI